MTLFESFTTSFTFVCHTFMNTFNMITKSHVGVVGPWTLIAFEQNTLMYSFKMFFLVIFCTKYFAALFALVITQAFMYTLNMMIKSG